MCSNYFCEVNWLISLNSECNPLTVGQEFGSSLASLLTRLHLRDWLCSPEGWPGIGSVLSQVNFGRRPLWLKKCLASLHVVLCTGLLSFYMVPDFCWSELKWREAGMYNTHGKSPELLLRTLDLPSVKLIKKLGEIINRSEWLLI